MIDEKKFIEFINSKEFQMRFIRSPKSVQEILLEFIEEQPKIGEWIPCKERLPEESGWYIVTCVFDNIGRESHELYYNGQAWGYEDVHAPCSVIAWKYRPRPYHEP